MEDKSQKIVGFFWPLSFSFFFLFFIPLKQKTMEYNLVSAFRLGTIPLFYNTQSGCKKAEATGH